MVVATNQPNGVRRGHCGAMLALALAAVFGSGPAFACAFHSYLPEKSAIDWIIESDHLVAARSHPDDAFRFEVTETLVDGGRKVILQHLVDSSTRRILANHPADAILFAYDSEQKSWRRIARLTPEYRRLVEEVLAEKDEWVQPYDAARLEIFEALQDHPERALRYLALLEIDRAPYALLREMEIRIPVKDLLAAMNTPQAYPYQPIRALLLGLSEDEMARFRIRSLIDTFFTSERTTPHLGAFATALVEIDGVEGVHTLERGMLSDDRQPLDKLEQVVEALAIHNGFGSDEMRANIASALLHMVRSRPETAPLIARQFGNREDWSQADNLEMLVRERKLTAAGGLIAVAVYVAQAKAAAPTDVTEIEGERG